MSITRRAFVRGGALGLVSFGLDPLFLSRAAYATWAPSAPRANRRTLVCLFQRGAVDGLSMLVPHGDAQYYRERPRIAIPRSAVVDLQTHVDLETHSEPADRPTDQPCAILRLVVRHVTPAVRPDDVLSGLRAVADLAPPVPAAVTRLAQGLFDEETGTVTDPLAPDREAATALSTAGSAAAAKAPA